MSVLAQRLIAENRQTRSTSLDLGDCGLTDIPPEIGELVWLESLSLASETSRWDGDKWNAVRCDNGGARNSGMTDLSPLAGLAALRSLWIAHADADDLAPLAALTSLQSLSIVNTEIRDLSPLAGLGRLRALNLAQTEVSDLAPLSGLAALEALDVSQTEVEDIAALAGLAGLRSLLLSQTAVRDHTPLAGLGALRTLDVSGTQINCLVPLGKLAGLRSLDVSGTHIHDLAPLAALEALESLTVSGMGISDLGPLAGLHSLKTIFFLNTEVSDLAPLASLVNLEWLLLVGSHVSDLAPLAGLARLESLMVSDSPVTDLGPLAGLARLSTLQLMSTQVADLAPLKNLTRLNSLNLSGTRVRDLAPLAGLASLQSLDFSNTGVSDIAPLAGLSGLQNIDMANTAVADLSPLEALIVQGRRVGLKRASWMLDGIWVDNCPLRNPPAEIVSQGKEAILNFFREREAGLLDHLYEAKMLILGEGGAGKTSLLRRLYQPLQELPGENETTKGIDIYRHDFKLRNGRTFRLNVWDFGGQEIYHATHQFFLTRRSLYLLLDDTRKDHKSVSDPGFKTWLDMIDLFGEHSPVLIFQNEKGGRSKEIDLGGIKGRYDNVKERYRGNLELPDSADQLRDGIELFASQLSHIGEALPASWIKVRADIEARSAETPHITLKEYLEIYSRHLPFDRTKAMHLSRYLHDLGVFLHFQDDSLLVRTVILQNRWATEAVYRILDDEQIKAKSGRFDEADCQRVWRESAYAEMHPELLALMENFELCYALPYSNPKTWLAPQLLSPVKPAALFDWNRPGDLVLRYRYTFMPKGIIGRLMVRLHRFAPQPELASITCVLFERDATQVLAELLPSGNEIELRAHGLERKGLLDVVATELDAVNGAFSGLRDKVGKWIPCHCRQCSKAEQPYLFEERALRKRMEDLRPSVECTLSYDLVDVGILLDGVRVDRLPSWSNDEQAPGALRTIKIFLASSCELLADRDEFDLYFRQRNDFYRNRGIRLEIVRWENFFDAMSATRLQDEYNAALRECSVFVGLFFTKTGKFTDEEFDAAHAHFKRTGLPHIFTYFKDAAVTTGSARPDDFRSLWAFQAKLESLGHFPTRYDNIDHLLRQFSDQLERLF